MGNIAKILLKVKQEPKNPLDFDITRGKYCNFKPKFRVCSCGSCLKIIGLAFPTNSRGRKEKRIEQLCAKNYRNILADQLKIVENNKKLLTLSIICTTI